MIKNENLSYEKRAVLENFFNKLFEILEIKDKKNIVDEAVNTFESITKANALSVKELNQKVVDETLHELATKDFVRAEIAEVRAEIAEVRTEIAEVRTEIAEVKNSLIKWIIGVGISASVVCIASNFALITFLIDKLSK